jgi:hypothetical protein
MQTITGGDDPVSRVDAVYVSRLDFETKVFCFAFRRRAE